METHPWAWAVPDKWVQVESLDQNAHLWVTIQWVQVDLVECPEDLVVCPEDLGIHHPIVVLEVHRLVNSTKIYP